MIGETLSTLQRAAPSTSHARRPPENKSTPPALCRRHSRVNRNMGDDENEALLAEAKHDPAKMVELLEHHRGLVLRVVDHYRQHFGTHDVDDLVQLGLLGLVQAARSYDPTKPKAAWSTHATLFVRREIWNQAVRPSMKASRLHVVSFQRRWLLPRAVRWITRPPFFVAARCDELILHDFGTRATRE